MGALCPPSIASPPHHAIARQTNASLLFAQNSAPTVAKPEPAGAGKAEKKPPPVKAEWDADTICLPAKLLNREWLAGDVIATLELSADAKSPVTAGTRGLFATLKLENKTATPQRVLLTGLRFSQEKTDYTARFFTLPYSSLPTVLPPHSRAEQQFRFDTFNDVPAGSYSVTPLVLTVAASDDLLFNGGFEENATATETRPDAKSGLWTFDDKAKPAIVKPAAPLSTLSQTVFEWTDYSKLPFTNQKRFNTQGAALLEAAAPGSKPVAEQTITGLIPGARYVAGVDSWNGTRLRVELLDAANTPLGKEERNFSGFFWHENVANWRGRTLGFRAPAKCAGAKIALLAARSSWWDNAFFVAEETLRRAVPTPATLVIADSEKTRTGDVVYLGDDRDTKGDWTGKYGNYAFILSAMSAPRDMVGGEVKPLKCDFRDWNKTYNNETIRVLGNGELRYTCWTGNPGDVQPRHWIDLDAMRTAQRRAPDNPQWGYRTSASWDDHGETHPTDAWGNDFYIRLQLPPGTWRVSYYFLDWNWFGGVYPRDYRLSFLDGAKNEVCAARAYDLGQGLYKVFRVQGGRDLTLRIRKDFTINSIISGVFVDRLEPTVAPPAQVSGANAERLKSAAARWREAAATVNGFAHEEAALKDYAATLQGALKPEAASAALVKLGDDWFAAGEYWRAGLAYDALPQPAASIEAAKAGEARALQFRVVFPRYAQAKLQQAVASLAKLPEAERLQQTRELAGRIFEVAIEDHTQSKGMNRLPMMLAKSAYESLEKLMPYPDLQAGDRARMLVVAERNCWYSVGYGDVVKEALRFWPTLDAKQKAKLGAPFFADHVVRPFGVLVQQDRKYLAQVQKLVDDFAAANPDTEDAALAKYELAAIYYQQNQRDKARTLCQEVVAKKPESRSAKLCQLLLAKLK